MPKNFARGAPPPENSWEWSGVADPRKAGAGKMTVSGPGAMVAKSGTIPTWPIWLGLGGVIGFLIGRPKD